MMRPLLALTCCLLLLSQLAADEGYRLPPKEVVEIVDAQPAPFVRFSPDSKWMLLIQREAMPPIADVSRRMLQLAGMRIDPVANGRFQTDYLRGISLRPATGGQAVSIPLPADARLSGINWSHKSDAFAYEIVTGEGTELYVVSVDDPATPVRLTERLSTVMGSVDWMPDGKAVLCQLVPKDRGAEPAAPQTPSGPNIQQSSGNVTPTRTYQDLLANPYDEALFDYYATAQLALIDLQGKQRFLGGPAIFSSASPSPDGQHLLVTRVERPYSYLLPASSFPHRIEVLDLDGNVEHLVAEIPLEENVPIEGVRTGPRNVSWRTGYPATLVWVEALDGGDPRQPAEHRDRFMVQAAPFKNEPAELLKTEHRAFGLSYLADPEQVITTEFDRDRRWIRSLLHDLSTEESSPRVLMDRSMRDRYGDPGRIVTEPDESGRQVARQDGDWIYRIGSGASPQGNLPFVDRQRVSDLTSERLWRCEPGSYESVVAVVSRSADSKPTVITAHETPATPTNYLLRDLATNQSQPLTDFADPTPQIRGIQKQLVKYQREDGVPLSATLYLPADYQPGQRLPLLVWAYPIEFNDADTAGQVGASPWEFTEMRGATHLTLLTQGYAIMDNATMPVIGHPETMNDTFIDQIVASAKAAIDKAVAMGVADPNRVGVGGHSYGAFMTANLLAHSDLFRAGIARSGAYNRTLTPFGFQSERRPLWEAKDVYFNISPFMYAHRINEPMLMIHGENDNNSGTFPIQSQRMYQAIKGNGGSARLVMLPNESHGYRARESVLHVQAEMIDWMNTYVKNASGELEN